MTCKKIAIDLDDVLTRFIPTFLKYYNEKYGHKFHLRNVTNPHLYNIWGISEGEFDDITEEFFESKEFKDLRPEYGARKYVKELNKKHELVLIVDRITEKPQQIISDTMAWLSTYFSNIFSNDNVFFSNIEEQTKAEVCQRQGCEMIIEDALPHAISCAKKRIPVLLLEKKWNKVNPKYSQYNSEFIIPVQSWKEIYKTLGGSI